MGKYSDIIDHIHPSPKVRMPESARAAQFAPFAALSGFEDATDETARITDKRIELSEYEAEELDRTVGRLRERIKERPKISVTYFQPDEKKSGGRYVQKEGYLRRIDEARGTLIFSDGEEVKLRDVVAIGEES